MLDGLKGPHTVVGIKQSTAAVQDGIADKAFVAADADKNVIDPFVTLCKQHIVPITYVGSKKELGKACGINVGAACAVIIMEPYTL